MSFLFVGVSDFAPLYPVKQNDLPGKAERFAKCVGLLQMYRVNHYYNKDVLVYPKSGKTVFDKFYVKQYGKKYGELKKNLNNFGIGDQQPMEAALKDGWRKGVEKAMFLLDYGTIEKIKEGYRNALSNAYALAQDPDLFPRRR